MCVMQETVTWITRQQPSLQKNSKHIYSSRLTWKRSKNYIMHVDYHLMFKITEDWLSFFFLPMPHGRRQLSRTVMSVTIVQMSFSCVDGGWSPECPSLVMSVMWDCEVSGLTSGAWMKGLSVEGDRRGGHGRLVSRITGKSSIKEIIT